MPDFVTVITSVHLIVAWWLRYFSGTGLTPLHTPNLRSTKRQRPGRYGGRRNGWPISFIRLRLPPRPLRLLRCSITRVHPLAPSESDPLSSKADVAAAFDCNWSGKVHSLLCTECYIRILDRRKDASRTDPDSHRGPKETPACSMLLCTFAAGGVGPGRWRLLARRGLLVACRCHYTLYTM
jgi:hypothetical protein